MKKLLFVLVMAMSVMAVNAQTTKTTTPSDAKKADKTTTTTTTTTSTKAANSANAAMLKVTDLPKAVTDDIERAYPGYTVKEVMNASANDKADYKVVIAKGNTHETLLYDKDGKLVKKVTSKSGTDHKNMKKK